MILKGDLSSIEIDVLSIHKAISNDFWENNWLTVCLNANFPGFNVNLEQEFRKDDFANFLGHLKEFLLYKEEKASFYTIEEGFFLNFLFEESGKIIVKGKITAIDSIKCSLEFSFLSDRFYVESFMHDIEMFLKENPIVGDND